MDSLRLGLLTVLPPDPEAARRFHYRHERQEVAARQQLVLSWLKERNLHHKEIAAAIGVHAGSVSTVLSGRAQLPKAWIKPISRLLGVTPEEFRSAWRPWKKKRQPIRLLTPAQEHTRKLIADLLAEHQLRQADLAKAIGVKQHVVSLMISGQRIVRPYWLPKIASFFGIAVDNFDPTDLPPPRPPVSRQKNKRYPPILSLKEERARRTISRLLSQNGVRQIDLAKALGASQRDISVVVNGKRRPPEHWYPLIADFFHVSLTIFE